MASQIIAEARQLLRSGQSQNAVNALTTAASMGDPDALLMLGELFLVGTVVRRDSPLSRDLFRRDHDRAIEIRAAIGAHETRGHR